MGRYSGFSDSDSEGEFQPVTWLGGYAIYAAHLIVVVYVASMIVTAVAGPAASFLKWLPFDNGLVVGGQFWRIFTFGLVNPPSPGFVFDMLFLVWFGRDVEKIFGHRKFLTLFGGIYLLPPLIFTVLSPWLHARLKGEFGALAVFVAFAALYPNVPLMFNVLAKWAAAILVGIYSLMALADRSWDWLMAIWIANGFAFAFVRFQQGRLTLPKFRLPARKPKLRLLPDPEPAKNTSSLAEVDALLDKIASSGINSLTPRERAKLDQATKELRKKAAGRR